jgi:hypothetical protein
MMRIPSKRDEDPSQDLMKAVGASVLASCSETDRHWLNRHCIGNYVKMRGHCFIEAAVKTLTGRNNKWHG